MSQTFGSLTRRSFLRALGGTLALTLGGAFPLSAQGGTPVKIGFAEGFLQTNRALAILLLLAVWGILADIALRRLERQAGAWKSRQVIARVPLGS